MTQVHRVHRVLGVLSVHGVLNVLTVRWCAMAIAAALVAGSMVATATGQTNLGVIKGHVVLIGKEPGNPVIRMGVDPKCSALNAGHRVIQESALIAADGSIANVF